MEGSWHFKTNILFYGDNSWTVSLRWTKFCTIKDHNTPTSLMWIIIVFEGAFEHGLFWNCEVMLGQTLNYFV
jgi:hypothetical protein